MRSKTKTKAEATLDDTRPLFESGPTPADLTTTGNAWHIPDEIVDDYLDAVREPTRAEWNTLTDRADLGALALRDRARTAAGLPPIVGKDEADRTNAHGRALVDNALVYDPRGGWPHRVDLAAYRWHLDIVEAITQSRTHPTREWAPPTPCPACGTTTLSLGGSTCPDCRALLNLAQQLEAGAATVNGATRLDLVRKYVRENP